ncbi:acidic mammalian chitinase-like [Cucurbita maxima]|uniref:Acidic mammalian chitinase-like n=1 Tax=Cucurbita maxima TaxID=3661 RepID=A0A6J1IC41_CUCMA|nr:acidic mammalian chitinase-like [Cucurbita maxima]
MALLKFLLCFLLFPLIFPSSIAGAAPMLPPVKAAYWPSWVLETFPPSAIDTALFTHVYFAFLMPDNRSFAFEFPDTTVAALSQFTTSLTRKNPSVKTLFSIGGGGSDSDLFARIASDTSSRQIFIDSSIKTARKFGFHGVDLDWEFPKDTTEMKYFADLIIQWRKTIDREAKTTSRPPLLLTAAVYYASEFLTYGERRSFPAEAISKSLDWINVMCFDYHGSWDTSATGAHAALFDPHTNLSSHYGLRSWISAGVPRNKMVMGIPLYGKSWTLKDPNVHGVGAPATAVGPGDNGILTYVQVQEFNKRTAATVVYDIRTVSAYSYVESSWVGYDSVQSTTTKVEFAQAIGLRGYFFWALSYDSADWEISTHASNAWVDDRL